MIKYYEHPYLLASSLKNNTIIFIKNYNLKSEKETLYIL